MPWNIGLQLTSVTEKLSHAKEGIEGASFFAELLDFGEHLGQFAPEIAKHQSTPKNPTFPVSKGSLARHSGMNTMKV